MEGGKDPFNRRPYPWGKEDVELLGHFRMLGMLRKNQPALQLGNIQFFCAGENHLSFTRSYAGKTLRIYLNAGLQSWEIPSGKILLSHNMQSNCLHPDGFCIMEE